MPKLTPVPAAEKSRLSLATENLAALRGRAAEIDRRGQGLVAELGDLEREVPNLALDALADEALRPRYSVARNRQLAIPAEIEVVKAERDALDGEIGIAEAALQRAQIEEAAERIAAKIDERPRLALAIDATLATLAAQYRAYHGIGQELTGALKTLGVRIDVGQYDDVRLRSAVRTVGHDLALAVGQNRPTRWDSIYKDRLVDDFGQWANAGTMAEGDDNDDVREAVARLKPQSAEAA